MLTNKNSRNIVSYSTNICDIFSHTRDTVCLNLESYGSKVSKL